MKAINMPAKAENADEEAKGTQKKLDKNSEAVNQANAILNKRKDEGDVNKKGEAKPTTMAGQIIVSGGTKMQQYGEANGGQQAQLGY